MSLTSGFGSLVDKSHHPITNLAEDITGLCDFKNHPKHIIQVEGALETNYLYE